MARLFDNNAANYMSRGSVNLGLNGATECSLGVWLNLTSTATSQRIIDKQLDATNPGCPFRIAYTTGTNVLSFLVNNLAAVKSAQWDITAPSTGVWTRVLFAWKRNALTSADGVTYYNGVAQSVTTFTPATYDATFALQEATNNYYVGIRPITLANPLNAALDWVCVWNRQLTAQEALLDYTNPRNVTNGLISRVRLGDTDPDEAYGGNMTVTGTLRDVTGNVPIRAAMPMPYATRVRPKPFAPGLAR